MVRERPCWCSHLAGVHTRLTHACAECVEQAGDRDCQHEGGRGWRARRRSPRGTAGCGRGGGCGRCCGYARAVCASGRDAGGNLVFAGGSTVWGGYAQGKYQESAHREGVGRRLLLLLAIVALPAGAGAQGAGARLAHACVHPSATALFMRRWWVTEEEARTACSNHESICPQFNQARLSAVLMGPSVRSSTKPVCPQFLWACLSAVQPSPSVRSSYGPVCPQFNQARLSAVLMG
eukprot:358131-Chlamydomonas_euryale.AAC.1